LQRFGLSLLLSDPPPIVARRRAPSHPLEIQAISDAIVRLFRGGGPEFAGALRPEGSPGGARVFAFGTEAGDSFHRVEQDIRDAQRSGEHSEAWVAHLIKSKDVLASLAGLDHALTCIRLSRPPSVVGIDSFTRAEGLWRFYLGHAGALYRAGSPATKLARRILDKFDDPNQLTVCAGCSTRDVRRATHKTAAEVDAALDELADRGLLRVVARKGTGGTSRTIELRPEQGPGLELARGGKNDVPAYLSA
jgi:hypothetical protein